jgi:hypothetical protein
MTRIATIRRPIVSRAPLPADYGEYAIWGAALPAATPVDAVGGFRLEIGRHLARKRRAIDAHRSQTTNLIEDDPNGFRLTGTDLARFVLDHEFFSRAREWKELFKP